jgi:hypothetical protein
MFSQYDKEGFHPTAHANRRRKDARLQRCRARRKLTLPPRRRRQETLWFYYILL